MHSPEILVILSFPAWKPPQECSENSLMRHTIRLLVVVLVILPLISGCGGEKENQVIQPAEVYQPTDQERANARQAVGEQEKTKRTPTGFSGN